MSDRIVTSYPNPDTDGVACALALSQLLGEGWRPVLLGTLGEEPAYALSQSGLEPPPFAGPESVAGADALALVDTHHLSQLPTGFPVERVTLIVDHHPKGNPEAFPHAHIYNEAVGAAATLVAARWLKRPNPDPRLLKLLSFAILSNTLHFSAPSTAAADREIYARLARQVPLSQQEIQALFARRAQVLSLGLEGALQSDLKLFDCGKGGQLGIAQLELYDLLTLINPEAAAAALAQIAQARSLPRLLFNGVDIRKGKSLVVCANEESRQAAERLLGLNFPAPYQVVGHILLRKTDFLPRLERL